MPATRRDGTSARLAIVLRGNHVPERVATDDAAADRALYRDASVPVDPALISVIASMVTGQFGEMR